MEISNQMQKALETHIKSGEWWTGETNENQLAWG